MPSNFKSPYASSFNSAISRGTPCFVVVQGIAKRCSKTPNQVFESLFKGGCCYRQKFNGTWIYWACDGSKSNSTNWKKAQWNCWQSFMDWCICSGTCTPEQLWNNTSSQNNFMSYCKKFWGKQFNGTIGGSKSTSRKRTSATGRKSRTTSRRGPSIKSHSVGRTTSRTRRYRRAA